MSLHVGDVRRPSIERMEERRLMSDTIAIGLPPPTDGAVAQVVVLTPSQTDSGRPQITVTVNPPPDVPIPNQATPKPAHQDLVIVKVVDKPSTNL
jgi:hypothetical protein